ncbi:type II secretion system F family protein [Bacillus thuringiensis]|uniref:type II secretion system F family protein n=1 Tax=Bacillus thuringiensis TaxID=1428 RepID=UPI0021B48136|nr:pilus assembly protein TadB [Bacillus thuringiensis]
MFQLPSINMSSFKSQVANTFTMEKVLPVIINGILIIAIVICAMVVLNLINEKRMRDKLHGRTKKKRAEDIYLNRVSLFKRFYQNLEFFLIEKGKEGLIDIYYYGFFVANTCIFIGFIVVKQYFLAIVIPLFLVFMANKIIKMLAVDLMEQIEEQLPSAIDHIIRVSSKYGDMKSIIYETARSCENPLREILESVSRKMISGDAETVLLQFGEEYDNVWINSLVFTLISYMEDASKTTTIENLRHLRNILEKENRLKKSRVTDAKYSVAINYFIAILASGAGLLNIIFNPKGREFFFSSFLGLICFLLGYGAVLGTIMLNIKMTRVKKSK